MLLVFLVKARWPNSWLNNRSTTHLFYSDSQPLPANRLASQRTPLCFVETSIYFLCLPVCLSVCLPASGKVGSNCGWLSPKSWKCHCIVCLSFCLFSLSLWHLTSLMEVAQSTTYLWRIKPAKERTALQSSYTCIKTKETLHDLQADVAVSACETSYLHLQHIQ